MVNLNLDLDWLLVAVAWVSSCSFRWRASLSTSTVGAGLGFVRFVRRVLVCIRIKLTQCGRAWARGLSADEGFLALAAEVWFSVAMRWWMSEFYGVDGQLNFFWSCCAPLGFVLVEIDVPFGVSVRLNARVQTSAATRHLKWCDRGLTQTKLRRPGACWQYGALGCHQRSLLFQRETIWWPPPRKSGSSNGWGWGGFVTGTFSQECKQRTREETISRAHRQKLQLASVLRKPFPREVWDLRVLAWWVCLLSTIWNVIVSFVFPALVQSHSLPKSQMGFLSGTTSWYLRNTRHHKIREWIYLSATCFANLVENENWHDDDDGQESDDSQTHENDGHWQTSVWHARRISRHTWKSHQFCYEDLSFISETGHDRNPLRLLRNATNLYSCVTVKQ